MRLYNIFNVHLYISKILIFKSFIMKSKLKTLVSILIYSFSVLVAYNFGYSDNLKEEYQIQNAIADRYFHYIGNPSTDDEHCTFIRVVYDDNSECVKL